MQTECALSKPARGPCGQGIQIQDRLSSPTAKSFQFVRFRIESAYLSLQARCLQGAGREHLSRDDLSVLAGPSIASSDRHSEDICSGIVRIVEELPKRNPEILSRRDRLRRDSNNCLPRPRARCNRG